MTADKAMKVLLCPASSGPHLELLRKYLETRNIRVRSISWFGKQTGLSLMQLAAYRMAGYRVLNLNWLPFNNRIEMRMARWACKVLGIKMVWTIHNLSPHTTQFGSPLADEKAMMYLRDWAVEGVVHSERTKADFLEMYGATLPINVVPLANYLDIITKAEPEAARKKLGLPEDKVVVLMLGPSRWNKGIRTYLKVVDSLPDNYIGVLAGGCRNPGIRSLISSYLEKSPHKFEARLEHLSDKEMAEYYAASDIFFMPFEDITTSGSIMEAISQGKAVVSTDRGNMPLLVIDGENGYLAGDEGTMVKRISSIDRGLAKRMGLRSLEIAKSYTWDRTAEDYVSIFKRVLEKRR